MPETVIAPNRARGGTANNVPDLSPLEAEVIDLFVQMARVLGLPKSVAELYGILFISESPLSMEDLMEKLGLSKGSASQGLQFLRRAGAVRRVYVPNQRRDYYVAQTELRSLLGGFVREQLAPHLDGSMESVRRIEACARQLPAGAKRAFAMQRIQKLRQWERRGKRLLLVMAKLLG